ncbi:MAG: radical SAM protein [Saprospiraceae bacterium]|nr:radical SAM protein [Saprospiraceae bacterium]
MTRRQIIDASNFLGKLTLAKVLNAAKILVSYYLSKVLRLPIIWGSPMSLSVEPTTACNLQCPECPSGLRAFTRPTGNLKTDFFRKTIDQIAATCTSVTLYIQGEPYINPSFLKMIAYANSQRLYTMTSTNGHFLTEEAARQTVSSGLDRLIISIDGTTQESYEAYRKNGNLAEVLDGTRRVIKWKKALQSKTPFIIFQFLVVKPNEHDIPRLHELADELGVDDVRLKTAQIYDYQNGNSLIPDNKRYSRYIQRPDGTYQLKHKLQNQCWKMWHSAVVTWDGIVVPCCFDKDAQHGMGDLKKISFDQIWKGESYHNFRSRLLQNRSNIDICTNCTEGCSVWA